MTKLEYAEKIAKEVNGEAKEVEKNNGVILTGVEVNTGSNMRPMIYIDDMYDQKLEVPEAVKQVRLIVKKYAKDDLDLSFLEVWDDVKPRLKARLLNKATKAEVKRKAGYGFDDLIIVPYIDIPEKKGAAKVTEGILKAWNKTADEVIDIAEENSKEDVNIQSIFDVLFGAECPLFIPEGSPKMIVVTNKQGCYGAYSIIPSLGKLKELFPNGFTVLPSSIHECIVVDEYDPVAMDLMVSTVNNNEVDPTEQLSNRSYRIA